MEFQRSFVLVWVACCLLISNGQAILVGNAQHESQSAPLRQARQDGQLDANSTFYYNADAFLINKQRENSASEQQDVETKQGAAFETSPEAANKSISYAPPAAPISMTSARNGRMLDLDALVGDFAASKAAREHSIAGNRQSRFLQTGGAANLDIGGGKRLHIQGFIPIVGVKDDQDEQDASDQATAASSTAAKLRPKVSQLSNQVATADNPFQPYGPTTSVGHATFGVQRYLNTDQQQQGGQELAQQQYLQQVDAKFSGGGAAASMVDSLVKRPIKKLTSFASGGGEQSAQYVAGQTCLCVPFYMCKNGFISESSLGKSQIQQMIQQQQLVQQPRQIVDNLEGAKRGLAESVPLNAGGQSYANSMVPVDERSFEREIITMAPLTADAALGQLAAATANQTGGGESLSAEMVVSASMPSSEQQSQDGQQQLFSNETNSDFAQDILGRMLGLKSGQQAVQKAAHSAGSGGVCGLLRSCCNIPGHLFPSQQDLANERLMAQYAQASGNKFGQSLNRAANQPPQISAARFQTQLSSASQPYGLPAHVGRVQPQLANNLDAAAAATSSSVLVHRTNQYPVAAARYGSSQVAQFQRGSAPQAMQSMAAARQPAAYQQRETQQQQMMLMLQQQQAQQQRMAALANGGFLASAPGAAAAAVGAATRVQNSNNGLSLGTRKLLDGRCGLRQSVGITGRVQNLQYSENAAEFGEFPAQAAILKRLNGTESLFVCGATLISQYWLATAAHCIRKHVQSELKIRLGEWDVHRDDEFYPFVEKEVRDVVVHPDFVPGNLINDIALVRLDSQVDPSLPHINPACLPTIDEQFSRQKCSVTGWGKDSFGKAGSFQSVLQKVELPVLGNLECEQALRQTRLGPHYRLHGGFVCAGGEGGRDACEGDGGSGLYCQQDGVIKVAGLVSWGIGCGQAGVPGVYVNMAHYRPWIENVISIDEDLYSAYNNLMGGGNTLISERSNSNATDPHGGRAASSEEPNAQTTISSTPETATTTTTAAP